MFYNVHLQFFVCAEVAGGVRHFQTHGIGARWPEVRVGSVGAFVVCFKKSFVRHCPSIKIPNTE
jgi:hypothetical protein